MTVGEVWTMIGSLGQWAGAAATFVAVLVALSSTKRLTTERSDEAKKRTLSVYKALLMEVRENRGILQGATPGWSYVHLHRSVWEAALSETWGLPVKTVEHLQDAYRLASRINDVVDTHIATEVSKRSIYDGEFKKLASDSTKPFLDADRELTAFLKNHLSVQVTPFGEDET